MRSMHGFGYGIQVRFDQIQEDVVIIACLCDGEVYILSGFYAIC